MFQRDRVVQSRGWILAVGEQCQKLGDCTMAHVCQGVPANACSPSIAWSSCGVPEELSDITPSSSCIESLAGRRNLVCHVVCVLLLMHVLYSAVFSNLNNVHSLPYRMGFTGQNLRCQQGGVFLPQDGGENLFPYSFTCGSSLHLEASKLLILTSASLPACLHRPKLFVIRLGPRG